MKLVEEWAKYRKEMVYDTYEAIVYEPKDYDQISRKKMLEEILIEYHNKDFLYHICTKKELDFLVYLSKNKLTRKDYEKYEWEMKELQKKCILSGVTNEVFFEQEEYVNQAIKYYQEHTKPERDIIIFIISTIKTNGSMLTNVLMGILKSMYQLDEKAINAYFGHPLFHFYCSFYYQYIESLKSDEEVVYYRPYIDILDDLELARKTYGIGGTQEFDIRDVFDSFYYGFPIRNAKVKKMVEIIKKLPLHDYIFQVVDEARVLNNYTSLPFFFSESDYHIIEEALMEIPCAAMNGFTPKHFFAEKEKQINLKSKFLSIPQNNAHLSKNAADLYYKLYFALLDFVNQKCQINPKLSKIYRQEQINAEELMEIDEYLWSHKELIDEFIESNPSNFSLEELDVTEGFKTAVMSDHFVIVGFEREYTQILSDDGKLYMVKGVRSDIDKIVRLDQLPIVIKTTLLMFRGNIIYNSFLTTMNIDLGNGFSSEVLKESSKAMKFYHL